MAEEAKDAAKSFDAYEVIGVITPGAVLALGAILERPDLRLLLTAQGFSLGSFGLFVLVAFVLGHLLGGIGDLIERLIWLPFGMPTNWVRKSWPRIVNPSQSSAFLVEARKLAGPKDDLAKLSRGDWASVIRRVNAQVYAAKQTMRIDAFNRTYGMFRGLVAALSICLLYLYASARPGAEVAWLWIALASALWGMLRFGVAYGRELIVVFLGLMTK